jgi:hypothetical protein
MFSGLLRRVHSASCLTTGAIVALMPVCGAVGRAAEAAAVTTTPPNALTTVRRALREFDRFLDHHPLLEDELRLNPALAEDPAFLEKNPELREFLGANREVREGLKLYPRYFLYRALLRQASVPLRFSEIARLKDVFDRQPSLERALVQRPESIRDPEFLGAHAPLRDFLTLHPILGQAFLSRRESPDKPL